MWMTDNQIRTSYTQAVHPNKQIRILAQLNACSAESIVNSLERSGVNVKAYGRHAQKHPKKCDLEIVSRWDEYVASIQALRQEYSNEDLEELTGLSKASVSHYFASLRKPSKDKFEQIIHGLCLTRERFFELGKESGDD